MCGPVIPGPPVRLGPGELGMGEVEEGVGRLGVLPAAFNHQRQCALPRTYTHAHAQTHYKVSCSPLHLSRKTGVVPFVGLDWTGRRDIENKWESSEEEERTHGRDPRTHTRTLS